MRKILVWSLGGGAGRGRAHNKRGGARRAEGSGVQHPAPGRCRLLPQFKCNSGSSNATPWNYGAFNLNTVAFTLSGDPENTKKATARVRLNRVCPGIGPRQTTKKFAPCREKRGETCKERTALNRLVTGLALSRQCQPSS